MRENGQSRQGTGALEKGARQVNRNGAVRHAKSGRGGADANWHRRWPKGADIMRLSICPNSGILNESRRGGYIMSGSEAKSETRDTIIWQKRLLPFAITAISLMAIFFFISSVVQVDRLADRVTQMPSDKIEKTLAAFESKSPDSSLANVDYIKWKSLILLEQDVINHRYAQVNATLLLRAWTRNIGFLTGMIMAFIGAIFILAKLREGETSLAGEGGGAKATLVTSSPGIVLAVLGTILMSVTIVSGFEFSTTDAPVYVDRGAVEGNDALLPPPAPLEDVAPAQEPAPANQEDAR